MNSNSVRFNGADYSPERDNERLSKQLDRVVWAMKDEQWHTLGAVSRMTGDP